MQLKERMYFIFHLFTIFMSLFLELKFRSGTGGYMQVEFVDIMDLEILDTIYFAHNKHIYGQIGTCYLNIELLNLNKTEK